jgi:heme/copper-type cytochrome/quinol oxidase subunit 2
VIVLVLAIYSYSVWVSTTEAKPNEMTVNAIGQRYAWSFAYEIPESTRPDDVPLEALPQNIQDQFTEKGTFTQSSPQLHVYAGQPVKMVLNTMDSQHAFWIPAMRIKQDLLPGRTTEIRFTPILPGTYPVVCAELCGDGHGAMLMKLNT